MIENIKMNKFRMFERTREKENRSRENDYVLLNSLVWGSGDDVPIIEQRWRCRG